MEFNYEHIFKLSIWAMRLNKCHPAIKRDRKWISHFLFNHGIFTVVFFLIVYNIIFHNVRNEDFDEACKNGVLSVVFTVITFQYCIMLLKQDMLMNLMTLIQEDYARAKFLPIEQQIIMFQYAKIGEYVCKQWFVITCCGDALFPLKNVFLLTYHWVMGNPQLIPLYDLVYPAVIEEHKDNIFVYLLFYGLLMFYGLYAGCMYAAFVPIGPGFMLHACGQLEIVKMKINGLFEGADDEVEERLKDVVKQLQGIYSFIDQIQLCFRVTYEFTLKATTLILPITCYEVLKAIDKGDVPLEFIAFIVGGVLISSSPCFYSDLLMEKGENVRLALYTCGWEAVYKRRIRTTLFITMMRSLKPVAIRTLFRTVCLEALTDLFQQSYAIFNLMNAMWE